MSSDDCQRFLIGGKVQGVSYRISACAEARRLELSGWVRNLPDGRVEALVAGRSEALAEFARWLARGPRHAVVSTLESEPAEAPESAGFQIR